MGQVDERLGASTVETRPEQAYRSAAELLSLDRGLQKPARFLARGAAPRLELAHVPLPGSNWGSRIISCLTIALLGLAAAVALRSRPYPRLPASAVLVGLGVAWWWLLTPSVLGLVIVLLAVWMGVIEWGRPGPGVAVR